MGTSMRQCCPRVSGNVLMEILKSAETGGFG
jgi:hypothetical protein